MNQFASLLFDGNEVKFPLSSMESGAVSIDTSELYKKANLLIYDNGFQSVASCKSAITYIDGNEGILRYRDYDIQDLIAKDCNYLHIAYLLSHGELPTDSQFSQFSSDVAKYSVMFDAVRDVINAFPNGSHPMAILGSCFFTLASIKHSEFMKDSKDSSYQFFTFAIAQASVIVAAIFRKLLGISKEVDYNANKDYVSNFIRMSFGTDEVDSVVRRAFEAILVLHADHEQNASTTALRTVASTDANIFACLASAIGALWGPAHGGANEAVIKMLEEEIISLDNIADFVSKVKEKDSKVKLMGFGHRVYKNYDPRAKTMKEILGSLGDFLGVKDKNLFDLAKHLEEIALSDEYFIRRKLYPNVDFYSGVVMRALGVPKEIFTCIFALARMSGWASHYREMVNFDDMRIWRPRQVYIGRAQKRSL